MKACCQAPERPRPRNGHRRIPVLVTALLWAMQATAAPPVVLAPSGTARVAAGDDFATQVLGDPWDFDRVEDTFTPDSVELADIQVSAGVYRARTLEQQLAGKSQALFWLIHPGLANAQRLVSEFRHPETGRRVFSRDLLPIDPQRYRYLTARVRFTSATAQPLDQDQPFLVYYFESPISGGADNFGFSEVVDVPPNEWFIVSLDLASQPHPSSGRTWTSMTHVEGLRVDPTNQPGVIVEIDWMRLVAGPAAAQRYTVTWQGNGAGTYDIAARRVGDPGAPALVLADNIGGSSASVWLGRLPPGDYRIEVTGNGETGVSTGALRVNDVPRLTFTAPDLRGDPAQGYGQVENGNPWSYLDPADVDEALDFETVSYTNPAGAFWGRPSGSDSRLIWNTPSGIDTQHYRMLCFQLEVAGPRDIGLGSGTRVLYGNQRSQLTNTLPIITHAGVNEYCVGDLASLVIDPITDPQSPKAWAGNMRYLRLDPHEFPRSSACNNNPTPANCHDVRIRGVVLAPFSSGETGFSFRWTDADGDDNATIQIWLDDDRVPGNTPGSVEHLVGQIAENESGNVLNWQRPANVASGLWNVYARIADAYNVNVRYASGPLLLESTTQPLPGLLLRDGFE